MAKFLVNWEETSRYVGVVEADSKETVHDLLSEFSPYDGDWACTHTGSEILSVEEVSNE